MSRLGAFISVVALCMLLVLGGCARRPAPPATAPTAGNVIDVMVPCGQTGPFYEVLDLFQKANPGVEVRSVPENMVTITKQILDGVAKPDVYLTMGDLEMDLVEDAGLVMEGTRAKYAENSLTIMVPEGNPGGVHSIADLAGPRVTGIAIPDPETNSVGKHALAALAAAGIKDKVEKKIYIMRFAADTKDAAARQDVQASIGYYPCAVEVHVPGQPPAEPKKLKSVAMIPADLHESFWCEAAVIKGAKNPAGGRQLIDFLTTPEAREIFRKWHFVREEPTSGAG